jgi:DHA1 family multidrug resistance protein-like MFS transporter
MSGAPARAFRIPVLPLALFFGTFAWSFVYVSLPFYVQRLSPGDAVSTLRWTGWILGITSLTTVVTAPLWGRLAERTNPKTLYLLVESLQGIGFFLMAAARTLPELFLARLLLGIMGAASTFAYIIAGRSDGRSVRREVSAIQSAMTVGQVVGPLAGAVAAARFGFTVSFVIAGGILWGCAALVWRGVAAPEEPPAVEATERRVSWREVGIVCLLVLAGTTQIFFLPAVLPQILPPLGIPVTQTLEVGGLVIFVSGVAAAVGSLAAPRLADLLGERAVIAWSLGGSSLLLALFTVAPNAWVFGSLRFLQVLFVAPLFPLTVAWIAQSARGQVIGLVNSSRIAAAFLGPVMATTLLSWFPAGIVYGGLAVLSAACLPLVLSPSWPRVPHGGDGGRS